MTKLNWTERLKNIPAFFGIRLGEEPRYRVLLMDGEKEIRKYPPLVLVQTHIAGDFETSISEGHARLTAYLEGGNHRGSNLHSTMPMFMHKAPKGWNVALALPAGLNIRTAPRPTSVHVALKERPAQTVASLRFTGGHDAHQINLHASELSLWLLKSQMYQAVGPYQIEQYDPPGTIPFLRRNEIQVAVVEST